MSKLQAALSWAARGFRVFPLRANTKTPTSPGWTRNATADPATIAALWRDPMTGVEQDHNIGVLTTGLVVLDPDVKGGQPGVQTFYGLGLDFDTLTVRTPTGGLHVYYRGEAGNADIGPSVNVRSQNGYVVGPGSTIDGVAYTVEIDEPLIDFPDHVRHLLTPPRAEREARSDGERDKPEGVQLAQHFLEHNAEIAIAGQGGNNTTFAVCARIVRDYGLTPETAMTLLLEHWNERCDPPWPVDELFRIAQNADDYGENSAGRLTDIAIPPLDIPPPTYEAPVLASTAALRFGEFRSHLDLPARPWLMAPVLMRRYITTLIGTGAAGKTTLGLTIAALGAVGQGFAGMKLDRPIRVLYYNSEDDRIEMERRLNAICMQYGLDLVEVGRNLAIVTGDDFPLVFTKGDPPIFNPEQTVPLAQFMADGRVDLAIFDPLVELHTVSEDDNVAMMFVMRCIRELGRRLDASILLMHHTRKPANASAGSYAGDVNSGRGAGAIGMASRVALTLYGMDEKDAARYGVSEKDRFSFVRLDGAKMNMSQRTGEPLWLKFHEQKLFSGDAVGVLVPHDLAVDQATTARLMANVLSAEMTSDGVASLPVKDAVALLQRGDMAYAQLAHKVVAARIQTTLAQTVVADGGTGVRCIQQPSGGWIVSLD